MTHATHPDAPGLGTRVLGAVLGLAARLPFAWVQALGGGLGWLSAWIPNEHRAITRRNLELCFPELDERERRALERASLVESGRTLTETVAIWLGPPSRAHMVVEVEGETALRDALATGRGAVICSPHLGSWEMAGLYLGSRYPMTSMYRPPRKQAFEHIVRRARERTGARLVPTDAGGIRALYQGLKEGRLIGILPDQDPRDPDGAFAPFFGIQANTMTLVSRLAQKTGVPVFLTFAERLPRGRGFRLRIIPAPQGIDSPDLDTSAAALNRGVEQCVRLAPAQYQWSYKRFRTRPKGEPELY